MNFDLPAPLAAGQAQSAINDDKETRVIGVTGGTGFVGKRVVARLAKSAPVRVLAPKVGTAAVKDVEYSPGEVTSPEAADRFAQGCTSIIHLAGIAHSTLRTEAERQRSYSINVEGTRVILNAALRHHVRRFVFVSTSHVYALHSGLDIQESATVDASGFYSFTKIEAEKIVREASQRGMEVVIARPCLIYGSGVRFNLEQMMRGIDHGYYFHISGVNPMRSFLSVENAARAMVHLASSSVPAGVYNLADPTPYSLVDFGNALADRMRRHRPRTVPSAVIAVAGAAGSVIEKFGVHAPFSGGVMAKLLSDFTISTSRLAKTRFQWDDNVGAVLQQMVDHYLNSNRN
jgi:nucleoside-diphosphate-sugar epimerase